jgi:predicted lipoprotein with Yx(FWY)xxD motif
MGMALYVNSKDTPNTSTCTGACATVWLPVLTVGTPLVGDNMGGASTLGTPTVGTPMVATPAVGASTGFMGLNASLLGTANRADGTVQVTYNGWPLYTYSQDLKVGDIKGQGFNSQWYLITADGNMAK